MNILVGTAGFSYKDWAGIVYPADLKTSKIPPLQYLAQFYDCCEINTSFYGPLRSSTGKQWCAWVNEVNPQFLFTAKLYKAFTHSPIATVEPTSAATLRFSSEDERLTREGLDSLAMDGKLGAVLAQFPISFKNTEENRTYLQKLIAMFGGNYPLAIEVRHSSWNEEAVLHELSSFGVGFVNIDQPLLGKALRGTAHLTSRLGYVRLHGRNYQQWFSANRVEDRHNFLYTPDQLEPWKERIEEIADQAERTFVVANNHYLGKAAANATELKSMLSGKKVKAPGELVKTYPELIAFATT
ncbi:MAG TPA: DUF72 domain-containing protein [Bryobacteraceae bacterium]|nr:DUF72 domain-containing protein [Bryobacteraceae bacterium]